MDAGICHGSAGLAHIFNRFFQATGDSLFKEAAIFWIRQTLSQRGRTGVGGYNGMRWLNDNGHVRWKYNRGILTGAAGVGLVLASALSAVEPEWDRLFLTAAPMPRVTPAT